MTLSSLWRRYFGVSETPSRRGSLSVQWDESLSITALETWATMVDDLEDLSRTAERGAAASAEQYISDATNVKCSAQDLQRRAEYIARLQAFSWSGGWCDADQCINRRLYKAGARDGTRGEFQDHCSTCLHHIELQGANMNQSLRIEVVCPSCHKQHFDVQPSELNELICEGCKVSITESMITLRQAQEEEDNVG